MKYYFAPLEGLTNYVYRNIHAEYFGKLDKYFTPFLSPNQNKKFSTREKNDILPENNIGLNVVPQLLTNNSEHFIWACNEIEKMGYTEVNLNLGCPSGTVVAKKKGSGFLNELDKLDNFLDDIYSKTDINISIKTRLGRYSPDEFKEILNIFNKYPIYELTIHPRVQTDFYRNPVNKQAFYKYFDNVKAQVCYNGDIFKASDCKIENVNAVMLGRGLIANPFLVSCIKGENVFDKQIVKDFHDKLYRVYKEKLSGDIPVLHKMKEIWFYMNVLFSADETIWKKLRKTKNLKEYEMLINSIFSYDLNENAAYIGLK